LIIFFLLQQEVYLILPILEFYFRFYGG
jgi:hypothetical protein